MLDVAVNCVERRDGGGTAAGSAGGRSLQGVRCSTNASPFSRDLVLPVVLPASGRSRRSSFGCLEMTAAAGSVRCAGVQMRCVNSAGERRRQALFPLSTRTWSALHHTTLQRVGPSPESWGRETQTGAPRGSLDSMPHPRIPHPRAKYRTFVINTREVRRAARPKLQRTDLRLL